MAGQIIISNIKTDSDNAFSILANTGAVLFSANLANGITTNIANTRITGTITAGQLATSLNLATNNVQVASIQSATGTPAITFAANGQMTLANTPLQLTGGQLQFPATQIASGDANCLDDYEEGTWTPTAIGNSVAGTTTYSGRVGTYTKIGNQVTATGFVAVSAMTGTNYLLLSLPFACNQSYSYFGSVYTYNLDWPSAGSIVAFAPANNAYIRIHVCVDNAIDQIVAVENASWEANYTITYQVN